MAASDASSDRYDPWYVKVAFGLFLSALVGFPAVLYGLPATQRVSELRSGRAHPRAWGTPSSGGPEKSIDAEDWSNLEIAAMKN